MADYIMADVQGDINSFNRLLDKIAFKSGEDRLIINGNILDIRSNGIKILFTVKDMVEKGDAVMIKGNHELFIQMCMEGTLTERNWVRSYDESMLKELQKLEKDKQDELLTFIKGLPLYIERETPKFGKTIITHTGLMNDYLVAGPDECIDAEASIRNAVNNDEYGYLISADIHYWGHEKLNKIDKYIICGHVPTYQLGPEYKGRIFRSKKYMDIDAGSGYRERGGRLACYSIDEDKEFYV
ncbi:MAG: metallophosphoesterase [Lachnospiraceae bacterium]|nr:metallophosphoesterase [Lachnospiraceae bacterium]